MQLRGERLRLSQRPRSNPWRIGLLASLILMGLLVLRLEDTGQVQPLFQATPTPTRTANSFQEEAEVQFAAGDLGQAIAAYQNAVQVEAENAALWAQLARVQTYFSSLQPSRDQRLAKLAEARQSIERAVELAPDSGFVQAIRALVYDWSASAYEGNNPTLQDDYIKEANESAIRAIRLEPESVLARASQAEVMVDQGNYLQAYNVAQQAVELAQRGTGPDDEYARVDAHRVFGLVLETNGEYRAAIDQYEAAIKINPNLTFLYLRSGANYRRLAGGSVTQAQRDQLIGQALEAFARAAKINEQNDVSDPIPYLAIGRTYLQEGEFFIAARNVERAVLLDPTNPELYGFLGIVYYKGRNYESALRVLECAVDGCDETQNAELLCEGISIKRCDSEAEVIDSEGYFVPGQRLSSDSLEYYYTYASALAFLHKRENDYCTKAEGLFDQLMATYGDDPTVAAIVSENRTICEAAAGQPPPATPTAPPNPNA